MGYLWKVVVLSVVKCTILIILRQSILILKEHEVADMADELQALLNKIVDEELSKTEGTKEKILAQAKAEAETILKNARSEADEIISSAQKEAQVFRTKGEEALRQASRDVLLSLRGAMDERIKAVALAVAGKELSGEALGKTLVHLIEAFLMQDGNEDRLEVLLDEKEQQVVEDALAAALDVDLRARCQLSPVGGMGKGFKLVFSGDSVVYDFSDQALAETLASHLSGRLAAIVSGN